MTYARTPSSVDWRALGTEGAKGASYCASYAKCESGVETSRMRAKGTGAGEDRNKAVTTESNLCDSPYLLAGLAPLGYRTAAFVRPILLNAPRPTCVTSTMISERNMPSLTLRENSSRRRWSADAGSTPPSPPPPPRPPPPSPCINRSSARTGEQLSSVSTRMQAHTAASRWPRRRSTGRFCTEIRRRGTRRSQP
jgi:hypothetical protein